jgi:hypothetical protein
MVFLYLISPFVRLGCECLEQRYDITLDWFDENWYFYNDQVLCTKMDQILPK